MDLIAYKPPPGTWRGLDTVGDDDSPGAVITRELAERMHADGYRFVARYLRYDGVVLDGPRPGGEYDGGPDGCYSLSIRELRDAIDGGLAVLPVQYGTFGDAAHGQRLGKAAVQSARLLGLPQGAHLFCDLEGAGPRSAGPTRITAYVEAWAAAVTAGGFLAGLYLTDVGLTARQLYGLRGVTCYWSAAGPVPANPLPRGYSLEQDRLTTVCGMRCDTDTVRTDRMGDGPALVASPDIAAAWHGEAMGMLSGCDYLQA